MRAESYVVYGIYRRSVLLYVGLTCRVSQRRRKHSLRWPDSDFRVLIVCDREYAMELERKLIAEWRPSENVATGASHGLPGPKHSAESRAKMAVARRGVPLSPEHRAAISRGSRGVKKSKEHNAKVSAALTGRKFSAEHRQALSARVVTPEWRARLAVSQRGRKHSKEHRAKNSEAQKRRHVISSENIINQHFSVALIGMFKTRRKTT